MTLKLKIKKRVFWVVLKIRRYVKDKILLSRQNLASRRTPPIVSTGLGILESHGLPELL